MSACSPSLMQQAVFGMARRYCVQPAEEEAYDETDLKRNVYLLPQRVE